LWEDERREAALQISTEDCRRRWESRIQRAQELQGQHSAIANALRFYKATLEFQSDLACRSRVAIDAATPLRQQINVTAVCAEVPAILSLSIERGPDPLGFEARRVHQAGEQRWRQLVEAALIPGEASEVAAEDFFVRACLQPIAENLQLQLPKDPNYNQNVCPVCGGLPQLAALRPEGEGASRSLCCSFCLYEWQFRRIVCPWCGEEDKEKLPHYSSEAWKYVHVEACDNCQRYFKAVDMTIDGLAVPLVDEAALAVLDVWASGLGYTKIIRNMIGF
jgi:FdhE protein